MVSSARRAILVGTEGADGDYDCEITILADGWKFTLRDPYSTAPILLVRQPGSGEEGMCMIWRIDQADQQSRLSTPT